MRRSRCSRRRDPVFTTPNEITDAAWRGWVQERGLYFLGERDPRYRDLVALEDPFPNNRREARRAGRRAYGKGRWVYVGLGLWRELPAGVDGAYQLLANLISLSHAETDADQRKFGLQISIADCSSFESSAR